MRAIRQSVSDSRERAGERTEIHRVMVVRFDECECLTVTVNSERGEVNKQRVPAKTGQMSVSTDSRKVTGFAAVWPKLPTIVLREAVMYRKSKNWVKTG